MFRFLITLCFVAICMIACKQTTTTEVKTDSLINSGVNDILLQTNFEIEKLKGLYSGTFDGSPISISINYVSGKNVSGYNVHKGLKRNMRGTMEPFGTQIKLMLDEPGNNRFDGHFEMFIDTASLSGKGTWKPKNDSSLKTKDFSFTKTKDAGSNMAIGYWADTANSYRSINIKFDGSALYNYYENKGMANEQLESVAGSWQQKKDSIIIFWQPNKTFPSRRTSLFMQKEKYDDDTTSYFTGLKGENTFWSNNEF